MSSHWEWLKKVVAQHDRDKPFPPENGVPLKFAIGDPVVYTNEYGVSFHLRVTGFYKPDTPCSLYATGSRYLLDWSCHWFPVTEAKLQSEAEWAETQAAAAGFLKQTESMCAFELDDWYEANVGYRLSEDDIKARESIEYHRSSVAEMMCLHQFGEVRIYQALLGLCKQ